MTVDELIEQLTPWASAGTGKEYDVVISKLPFELHTNDHPIYIVDSSEVVQSNCTQVRLLSEVCVPKVSLEALFSILDG